MKHWKDALFALFIVSGLTFWMQKDMLAQGSQASQFILPTLDNSAASIINPNQPTLVYFFAPWCSICKLSMGNLSTVQNKINTIVVALDYQDRTEVVNFITDINVTVPILLGNPVVSKHYQVSSYPSYYIIDGKGKVLDRSSGYSSLAGLLWRTSNINIDKG
ncbi:MAG: TlpA disulfide reductase family protein [Oceanospirillaceae bacterium]